VPEYRRDVLADVVIARAFPERFGALVVMLQVRSAIASRLCGFGPLWRALSFARARMARFGGLGLWAQTLAAQTRAEKTYPACLWLM